MKEFFGQRTTQEIYFETDFEREHSGEYRQHTAWDDRANRDQFGNPQAGFITMQEAVMHKVPMERQRIHHPDDDVVPVRAVQSLPVPCRSSGQLGRSRSCVQSSHILTRYFNAA